MDLLELLLKLFHCAPVMPVYANLPLKRTYICYLVCVC